MKRKYNWLLAILIVWICAYILFLRTPTVVYQGESENWAVALHAERTGGQGNYKITFYYKGITTLSSAEYSIYPYYDGGYIDLDESGSFRYECMDCGFFEKEDQLMIIITWRDSEASEESEMDLFELFKIK